MEVKENLEDNKEAVQRFLRALADDDREVLQSLVHPDVTWWVPPIAEIEQGIPRPLRGRDRVPWIAYAFSVITPTDHRSQIAASA